jgi:hypothetical protein
MVETIDKASFHTHSNSVNLQMQHRLIEEGLANQHYRTDDSPSSMVGIEPTSTALAMAITTVWSADPSSDSPEFTDANLGGILCFVIDRRMQSRYLRLYDINTNQLIFQTEIYIGMSNLYKEIKPKFYCFPLGKTVIGLNFANLLDALHFLNLIKQFGWTGDPKQVAKDEEKSLGMSSGVTKPKFIGKKTHAGWNPLTQTFNLKEMPE